MKVNQKDLVRTLVSQVIPLILLSFYVFAIGTAIANTLEAVNQCGKINPACAVSYHEKRAAGVNLVLNLVGGLVSALVIAELTVAEPGSLPSVQRLSKKGGDLSADKIDKFLTTAFIGVWLLCGIASVLIYIAYPNAILAALSEFAKAWLGLAIASAYSYFEINKP